MRTLAKTVLTSWLEATEEVLTATAGLALFGEFVHVLGLSDWLGQIMPKPSSEPGYGAQTYVGPLVLMLLGGGRKLEDLRMLRHNTALATVLKRDGLPSADAVGHCLPRTAQGKGLERLARIYERIVALRIEQTGPTEHTFDADASQILAEKKSAHFTY